MACSTGNTTSPCERTGPPTSAPGSAAYLRSRRGSSADRLSPQVLIHHAAARLRGWMGLADQRWAEAVGGDPRPAGPPKAAAGRWRRPAARTARRLVHGAARRRATPGELSARGRLGGDSQMALQRKLRYFEVACQQLYGQLALGQLSAPAAPTAPSRFDLASVNPARPNLPPPHSGLDCVVERDVHGRSFIGGAMPPVALPAVLTMDGGGGVPMGC
jgi:hypothetical protein